MRSAFVVSGLLISIVSAHAEKVVASGRPLMLYEAYSTNPDCSSAGTVVMRGSQAPEHGRVSIHAAGVFPRFPESNIRNACNRRWVPGIEATYVPQRGYLGPDLVILDVLFPNDAGRRVTVPIQVM